MILMFTLLSASTTNISTQQPSANQDALDLVKMVDDLLDDISTRFTSTSTELFSKSAFLRRSIAHSLTDSDSTVDEMARRLDHLEASIDRKSVG